ncbi:MAG TPA: serine/threonine protein kinase [Pseudolabrys sp.]|nr:serine/threonine protein kinase [Pseudolabrys sp.]
MVEGWTSEVVLKRDVFSTVERGRYRTSAGEVGAVLRHLDEVPGWSRPLAKLLFARELRALKAAPEGVGPPLLYAKDGRLVRGFIDGVALHIAKPQGDVAYFKSAKTVLHRLHRAAITHNDLAKEQNWLRASNGSARLTDFQLAMVFRRRGKLFRVAAYEDIRHMLKHKRRYAPAALTARERKILARKSIVTRVWMATGKRVYYAITRGLFNFTDREGGGMRLIKDAPLIVARLKSHPQVRDAAVVAYPDRRAGVGLYAFVEADGVDEPALRAALDGAAPTLERMQIITTLPRRTDGEIRVEALQLIAMNQLDSLEALPMSEAERQMLAPIVAGRRNLLDRFSF